MPDLIDWEMIWWMAGIALGAGFLGGLVGGYMAIRLVIDILDVD